MKWIKNYLKNKPMKKLNGYWIARLVVKWLIPVMFFLIAVSENLDVTQG